MLPTAFVAMNVRDLHAAALQRLGSTAPVTPDLSLAALGANLIDHVPEDVGQPKIAPSETIGQLFVIGA